MKKIINPILRRELSDIFDKLKSKGYNSDSKIATLIDVNLVVVGRWRRLEVEPEEKNLKRLRALAEGRLVGAVHEPKIGYTTDAQAYAELKGKFDLLFDSLIGVKTEMAKMADRLAELEEKKKTQQKQHTNAETATETEQSDSKEPV